LLVNYGTAHLALTSRAHLQSGETVLVTAAAGGVGLATVELARLMGASRVIAACGSDAKLSIATTKGAG
jgi:NADPH2:quinone reductase